MQCKGAVSALVPSHSLVCDAKVMQSTAELALYFSSALGVKQYNKSKQLCCPARHCCCCCCHCLYLTHFLILIHVLNMSICQVISGIPEYWNTWTCFGVLLETAASHCFVAKYYCRQVLQVILQASITSITADSVVSHSHFEQSPCLQMAPVSAGATQSLAIQCNQPQSLRYK